MAAGHVSENALLSVVTCGKNATETTFKLKLSGLSQQLDDNELIKPIIQCSKATLDSQRFVDHSNAWMLSGIQARDQVAQRAYSECRSILDVSDLVANVLTKIKRNELRSCNSVRALFWDSR